MSFTPGTDAEPLLILFPASRSPNTGHEGAKFWPLVTDEEDRYVVDLVDKSSITWKELCRLQSLVTYYERNEFTNGTPFQQFVKLALNRPVPDNPVTEFRNRRDASRWFITTSGDNVLTGDDCAAMQHADCRIKDAEKARGIKTQSTTSTVEEALKKAMTDSFRPRCGRNTSLVEGSSTSVELDLLQRVYMHRFELEGRQKQLVDHLDNRSTSEHSHPDSDEYRDERDLVRAVGKVGELHNRISFMDDNLRGNYNPWPLKLEEYSHHQANEDLKQAWENLHNFLKWYKTSREVQKRPLTASPKPPLGSSPAKSPAGGTHLNPGRPFPPGRAKSTGDATRLDNALQIAVDYLRNPRTSPAPIGGPNAVRQAALGYFENGGLRSPEHADHQQRRPVGRPRAASTGNKGRRALE